MILNHRMRRLAIPIAVLAVGLLLAPTSSVGAPMSSWDAKACGRIGGTLVFAQAQEAVTLDPHDAVDGFSVNNTSNVFDTLVRFKVDSTRRLPPMRSWHRKYYGQKCYVPSRAVHLTTLVWATSGVNGMTWIQHKST